MMNDGEDWVTQIMRALHDAGIIGGFTIDYGAGTVEVRPPRAALRALTAERDRLDGVVDYLADEAERQRRKESEQAYEEKLKHGYCADALEEAVRLLREAYGQVGRHA